MSNEFNIELKENEPSGLPKNVIVFDAQTSKESINAYGFEEIFREIDKRTQEDGYQKVYYMGDGTSSTIDTDLRSLRENVEIVDAGVYSRMKDAWRKAGNGRSNYLPPEQTWGVSDVDFVILEDIVGMESPTLQSIYLNAKRVLKTGGVMYMRINGSWRKFMKDNNKEFKDISQPVNDHANMSLAA